MKTLQFPLPPLRAARPHTARKWLLGLIMVAVLVTGGFQPLAGWVVPLVMGTGIALGFVRGRYSCGNLCPRGSFFDSWFLPLGGRRPIPVALRRPGFRWSVVALLMGMMVVQGAQNPTSFSHWGHVFWLMCLVTTAVGVVLGLRYSPRTWCSFCPIGTLAKAAGLEGEKRGLRVESHCRSCHLCDHRCPMQIAPMNHLRDGRIKHGDCIQCGVCVTVCPAAALGWENRH